MWAWQTAALRTFAHETLAPERLEACGLVDPSATQRLLTATNSPRQDRGTFKLWSLLMLQLWAEGLQVSGVSRINDVCRTTSVGSAS